MENSNGVNKHDDVLLKLFEAEGQSVNKFFDAVFGFFSRKSPELIFDSSKHYGKQLLVSNYEKWQNKYLKSQKSPVTSSKRVKSDVESDKAADEEDKERWSNPGGPTTTTNTASVSNRTGDNDSSTRSTNSKKDVEKLKLLNFDTTNGAVLDCYSWTQTADDVDLRIPVEETILKGNQVKVHIERTHLKVEILAADSAEFETVIEGDLAYPVRMDDCVWLLSPGQHIAILLEKFDEKWWDRCLAYEDQIDMKKIKAVRDYHSLPEEEKMQIEKIICDKEKKERGEPTSDQTKMENILRKAWNAEGSPFKDQPFDPSIVDVINSK